ncbi:6696_t:CDS:1 [Scutellospora calospora]|uniref:6696_t:CDS:1 n=1 Tax=Scutellospora calospora TaxID=85575 RepID=A0ACA9K8I4_9GLOM|nr:6696_t:CDS:1 [Scutellospora calospora]
MNERQSRIVSRTERPKSDCFNEEDKKIAELITPESEEGQHLGIIYQDLDYLESERNHSKKYLCIACLSVWLIMTIICIVVYYNIFSESNNVTEYDISKIPFQYQLSLRYLYSINYRYDYVISSLPDHEFAQQFNFTEHNVDQNSNNTFITTENKQIELGILISRPLKILTPGYYEVQEDRCLPNGTMYRVITAIASFTRLFYLSWTQPMTIEFVNNLNEIDHNETHYQDLISCKYQFTWTFTLNGYVNRKCKNESEFLTISYVKGSSLFGFMFYNLDETKVYAHTTVPVSADRNLFFRRYYL